MSFPRKIKTLQAVALAALVCAVGAPSALAATKAVGFTTEFVDRGTRISGIGACSPDQPGLCEFRFEGIATMKGPGLTTFVDYFGYGQANPMTQEVTAQSWDRHTGTLAGCGTGSFVMHQTEINPNLETFDPATGTFRMTLDWKVLEGSGTGDFTGATGSGSAFAHTKPDMSQIGQYTGTITCVVKDEVAQKHKRSAAKKKRRKARRGQRRQGGR